MSAVDKMREASRSQIDASRHSIRSELLDGHTAERIAKTLLMRQLNNVGLVALAKRRCW